MPTNIMFQYTHLFSTEENCKIKINQSKYYAIIFPDLLITSVTFSHIRCSGPYSMVL